MPSFGPGRFDSKAKTTTTNATDKARKNSLMEDLFGKQTRTNISYLNRCCLVITNLLDAMVAPGSAPSPSRIAEKS